MSRSIVDALAACLYIVGIIVFSYCIACCSEYMYKFIRWYSVEPIPLPTQIVPLHARPCVPALKTTKVQPVRKYVVVLNPNNVQSLGSHISSE